MTTKDDRNVLAEGAFQRSRIYELLSHVFGEPSAEFVEFIAGGEFKDHVRKSLALHPELPGQVHIRRILTALIDQRRCLPRVATLRKRTCRNLSVRH